MYITFFRNYDFLNQKNLELNEYFEEAKPPNLHNCAYVYQRVEGSK